MTTQEAYTREIKPRPDDTNKNERTILIFPNMTSLTHAILTGNKDLIKTFFDYSPDFDVINQNYIAAKQRAQANHDCPVNVVLTATGLIFNLTYENEPLPYYEFTYQDDQQQINLIAEALNALVSSAFRTIPKLIQNEQQCRNVTKITENPLYDIIVFTYSLYHGLGKADTLVRSYLQHILSTKQTTYITMCQNTSYVTNLPDTMSSYYTSGDFLRQVPLLKLNEETKRYEEVAGKTEYAAVIANYSGQKKKTRLFLRSSPKREISDSNRYMITGVEDTVV